HVRRKNVWLAVCTPPNPEIGKVRAIAIEGQSTEVLSEPKVTRTYAIWIDVALGAFLAIGAAAAAWWLYGYFRPVRTGAEQWFEADISRVWAVLTNRYSELHERSRLHPLFSLINSTFVYGLRQGLRLNGETAVRVWMSLCAALWAGLFYATSR